MQRLAVFGAGQMGGGIALTAAKHHKQVCLIDSCRESIQKQLKLFGQLLDKDIARGSLARNGKQEILDRITVSDSLQIAKDADYLIEAIPEDYSLKAALIKELRKLPSSSHAIFATNTSSLSITKLAAHWSDPSRVIGMHFMNPVPVMRLVEVIRGLQTSDDTFQKCCALAEEMGKTVGVAAADTPGFIANRLLAPYLNEAINVLMESGWHPLQRDVEELKDSIDKVMKLGTSVPMGPLQLADFVGLDTLLAIMRVLQEGLGAEKFRPSPLLVTMVDAGWVGKKSGRGFYRY